MEEKGYFRLGSLGNVEIAAQAGHQGSSWPPSAWSRARGAGAERWPGGQAGSSGVAGAGPAGPTAAALITPALQVPISSEKDSRDAAFNNYQ